MPTRKITIEIISRDGRLRAIAKDEQGRELGQWWIESRDHRRYLPFKPMPPNVQFLITKLPRKEQERIAFFLLTGVEGDRIEIDIPEDF